MCPLSDELTAAQEILDEEHQDLPPNGKDSNIYTLGCIGSYNVVFACLPVGQTGTNSAMTVAMQIKNTFLAIRFRLMMGIGGILSKEADILLLSFPSCLGIGLPWGSPMRIRRGGPIVVVPSIV